MDGGETERRRPLVVQKYGGSSVGSVEKLRAVARKVAATRTSGVDVVVVASAMGGTTDTLLELAGRMSVTPQPRELDVLLTSGERVSTALLAMALRDLGHDALSLTGGGAGVITDDAHNAACVAEVRPQRLREVLDRGAVPVVAGFQGQSARGEETTLGRGGSDTTAVALAAALDAARCDIYSDVEGVWTGDPRTVTAARRLDDVCHDDMLALARLGARVLSPESVEFARQRGVEFHVRSTFGGPGATRVHRATSRRRRLAGVTGRRDVVALRVDRGARGRADAAGLSVALGPCEVLASGGDTWLAADRTGSLARWCQVTDDRSTGVHVETDIGSASVVGHGVARDPLAPLLCRRAIESVGIEVIDVFVTSDAVSSVVPRDHVDDAQRALHDAWFDCPALVGSEGVA